MKPRSGLRSGFGMACFAAMLGACFTEVGNAEDERLVEGRFSIDYSRDPAPLPKRAASATEADSVYIGQFRLLVREAEYHMLDSAGRMSEKYLWNDDSAGILVDFTGKDPGASALPAVAVPSLTPVELKLDCRIPAVGALNLDTLDFDAFANPGYIKGVLHGAGRAQVKFLFALPPERDLHLIYSRAALATFEYSGNVATCKFTFFGRKWMAGLSVMGAQTWNARKGGPVALFDAAHNAALHQSLTAAFYRSFNASLVESR